MLNWLRRSPTDAFFASLHKFADSDLARSKLPEYRMELEAYARSSYDFDERTKLLEFISSALQDTLWRPVYNSLNLLEILFSKGSKTIIAECHAGKYFDVLQRLTVTLFLT
jgi:ENTH domain